jgi:hypothetical protein
MEEHIQQHILLVDIIELLVLIVLLQSFQLAFVQRIHGS